MVLFSAFGRPIVILRSCSSFIGKDSDLGTFMLFFGTGDGIYQWIPMEQPESEFTFPRTRLYVHYAVGWHLIWKKSLALSRRTFQRSVAAVGQSAAAVLCS